MGDWMATCAAVGLTRAEGDALQSVAHMMSCGMGLLTGRGTRLSTMRKLEKRGLVASEWGVVCDGDGWALEPERHRWVWTLTDAGKRKNDELDTEERKAHAD